MDAIYDLCMPDDNLMDSENQEIYKGANQVKDEWQKFFPPTPGS